MRTIEETRYFPPQIVRNLSLVLTLAERDGTSYSPTTIHLPTFERLCNPSKEETCAMTASGRFAGRFCGLDNVRWLYMLILLEGISSLRRVG